MSTPEPIAVNEMAGHVRIAVDHILTGIADAVRDGAFEMTAPATGQRFRVTVTEVPGWSDQVDQELAEVIRTEAAS